MKNAMLIALVALLLLAAPGCATWAAKDQLAITTAGADGYSALVRQTLDGTLPPTQGQVVTAEELGLSPRSVRQLVANMVTALWAIRKSLHQLDYVINEGTHPDQVANPDAPLVVVKEPDQPGPVRDDPF